MKPEPYYQDWMLRDDPMAEALRTRRRGLVTLSLASAPIWAALIYGAVATLGRL
ncbi:hypothetical protein [Croceicoccus naphthovorans]|uniref:hypothetical protein n=1 Tax=Croceicoccus naphthovorans TaxID=1348774 RepID=UPI000B1BD9F1|nr:hypothetical protein [Croceicoccus naphthovorans]MBB3991294.1 hypothetical protein [Croceicoccus naphthovorans]